MNPQDHDQDSQQIQDLAQQLARQFVTMRQQQTNRATPSLLTDATANDGDSNITNLASQLGSLLNARETAKNASAEEENGSSTTTSATSVIGIAGIPVASAAHDFDSTPEPSIYEADFVNVFKGTNAAVLRFEDRELLDLASDQMPIGRFFEEAETMADEFPDDNLDDIVIRRVLHWFKNEYFTWVNQPPCISCGSSTTSIGGIAPTAQERQQGAGVVETYKCTVPDCHQITRFPRYGGMSKVLFETRRGRCGEWANVVDVTRRYTVEYDSVVVKRRRSIREHVFAKVLHNLSESNLSQLSLNPDEVLDIRKRQALELDDLFGKNGDSRAVETKDRQSGRFFLR
ncbi:peptide-N4-(N-acetyl-beta- glucosaminyl)asparagine amidase [Linnemannia gamsii]|uniref:Peptide-N4-(N-acetyl-beta-glucosaminyl)asparagine amidase n=1 Tax=Linnemannia gamsii TaxID=64522 RepID=A0ABQ7JP41_9FUNG|nr:peptide-N4-(N-acetyl-beta- glucosaminyl)asparagine amidase [Linnemannia gamsii]